MIREITTEDEEQLLTGKDLILASRRFAEEDKRTSWSQTLSTFLLMILCFIGTFNPIHWSLQLVFSILFSLFIVRYFVIYHDYQHGAILRKSTAARYLMKLFGILVLAPSTIWKRTHDHHHHHNSKLTDLGIGSFPLISKTKYDEMDSRGQLIYRIKRHPIIIFSGYFTLFILDFNIISLFRSPYKHWDSIFALGTHILIGTLIYMGGGFTALIISWVLPFMLAHGLGSYLFYAQHNFPGAVFVENCDWDYVNAAMKSTSYMVMSPLMHWFTGNIGYHHVHHINHRIPFYRLKEAMDEMKELQNPTETSLHPKDIISCLRLKVWDAEKGKMVEL